MLFRPATKSDSAREGWLAPLRSSLAAVGALRHGRLTASKLSKAGTALNRLADGRLSMTIFVALTLLGLIPALMTSAPPYVPMLVVGLWALAFAASFALLAAADLASRKFFSAAWLGAWSSFLGWLSFISLRLLFSWRS